MHRVKCICNKKLSTDERERSERSEWEQTHSKSHETKKRKQRINEKPKTKLNSITQNTVHKMN